MFPAGIHLLSGKVIHCFAGFIVWKGLAIGNRSERADGYWATPRGIPHGSQHSDEVGSNRAVDSFSLLNVEPVPNNACPFIALINVHSVEIARTRFAAVLQGNFLEEAAYSAQFLMFASGCVKLSWQVLISQIKPCIS